MRKGYFCPFFAQIYKDYAFFYIKKGFFNVFVLFVSIVESIYKGALNTLQSIYKGAAKVFWGSDLSVQSITSAQKCQRPADSKS